MSSFSLPLLIPCNDASANEHSTLSEKRKFDRYLPVRAYTLSMISSLICLILSRLVNPLGSTSRRFSFEFHSPDIIAQNSWKCFFQWFPNTRSPVSVFELCASLARVLLFSVYFLVSRAAGNKPDNKLLNVTWTRLRRCETVENGINGIERSTRGSREEGTSRTFSSENISVNSYRIVRGARNDD